MKSTLKKVAVIILLLLTIRICFAAFDKDKPASSTSLRNSNPEILANWSALEAVIGQDHEFSTGGSNTGEHLQIKFNAPISTPTNAADKAWLYSKDVNSLVEVHILDESGNELQITSTGDLYSSTNLQVVGTSIFTGAITANSSITLGDGDDLIGSSTSDITFNTDKFTVAGDTGNTLVAGTLDVQGNIDPTTYETTNGGFLDEDDMVSDSDDKVTSQQSQKAFVESGAHKGSDGSITTGFRFCNVQGVNTKVFIKYLTGTTDNDSQTGVAHSLTAANILHVSAIIKNTSTSRWDVYDNLATAVGDNGYNLFFNNTNIVLDNVGTNLRLQSYRIKIEYTI